MIETGNCKTRLWKLPRYGNGGKTKCVFPPFPQRLENSPKNVEFPTVPTATTATLNQNENNQNKNRSFPQPILMLLLHFQIEFANEKSKMTNGK